MTIKITRDLLGVTAKQEWKTRDRLVTVVECEDGRFRSESSVYDNRRIAENYLGKLTPICGHCKDEHESVNCDMKQPRASTESYLAPDPSRRSSIRVSSRT